MRIEMELPGLCCKGKFTPSAKSSRLKERSLLLLKLPVSRLSALYHTHVISAPNRLDAFSSRAPTLINPL